MHLSRVDDERMTPLGPGRVGSAALADALSADHSVQPAVRPLINELSAGADWAALRFSPTYYGWGVPHGNGEPVILVPGFFGSDLSLTELFWWLARIGYEPHYSGLGFNSDCPDASATALASTVIRTAAESGRRIHLIGHSLGALIARSVAFEHSDCVDLLISLAAPFNDVAYVHPVLIETMATIRGQPGTNLTWNVGPTCFSGHCTCLFTGNIMRPATASSTPRAAWNQNRTRTSASRRATTASSGTATHTRRSRVRWRSTPTRRRRSPRPAAWQR